jgi:hypothetical protein
VHTNGRVLCGGQFLNIEEHLVPFCHQSRSRRPRAA